MIEYPDPDLSELPKSIPVDLEYVRKQFPTEPQWWVFLDEEWVMQPLRKDFDEWFDEVRAQVWDEGERRGRDNERELMMCQAQLRPSNSAVLIKNPYRPQHE